MNAKTVKFLAVLAVLAMAFAVFAVLTPAETDDAIDNPVAKIGDDEFATLGAAVAAAQTGDTIVIVSDIALTACQEINIENGTLTINLNGHNIAATDSRALWIKAGDVTITGTGTISANTSPENAAKPDTDTTKWKDSSSAIRVGDGSNYAVVENPTKVELTIGEGVTVSTNFAYAISVFGAQTEEKLIVKGSLSTTGEKAVALGGNGQDQYTPTTIVIDEGASVYSMYDYAIYHPQLGDLKIFGTVTGKGGVEIKSGSTMTTGESASITATAEESEQAHGENNNGTSTFGYAVALVENENYGIATVTLTKGTIAGDVVLAIDNEAADKGTINVNGAEITGKIKTSPIYKSDPQVNPKGSVNLMTGIEADFKDFSASIVAGENAVKMTGFTGKAAYTALKSSGNPDLMSIDMSEGAALIADDQTFNGTIASGTNTVNLNNVKGAGSGFTISKGSIIISGEMDVAGAQSVIDAAGGDVIIKDLTVTGDGTLVLTGDITIETDGNTGLTLAEGAQLIIGEDTKVDLKAKISNSTKDIVIYGGLTIETGATIDPNNKNIIIEESAKVTGLDDELIDNIVLDEKFILTGAAPINLSDFPTVIYKNKEYVVFGVDFGAEKPIIYGILKTSVPFTGKPIVPENVTVAGTVFGQGGLSITFTELPGKEDFDQNYHAGAAHVYNTKISTTYNGDSQYFSVMVPYVITKVASDVKFDKYEDTVVESMVVADFMSSSEVTMEGRTVDIKATLVYYEGLGHDAGYYIVVAVSLPDGSAIPEGAKYYIGETPEWKVLSDYVLYYIGTEFPHNEKFESKITVDLDGPVGYPIDSVTGVGVYDDYSATEYDITLTLTEDIGINIFAINDKNLKDALEYAEDMDDLYGKLPSNLQDVTIDAGEPYKDVDGATAYDVKLKGTLNWVFDYDDWDTNAKGYFLAYYLQLPDGKNWDGVKVTLMKTGSENKEFDGNNKKFDGFVVVKVDTPATKHSVKVVLDNQTFVWNFVFSVYDETTKTGLVFETDPKYLDAKPTDDPMTYHGWEVADTRDQTFYMGFMNPVGGELEVTLYYLKNDEKAEGELIYTENKDNCNFWGDVTAGPHLWYASFQDQIEAEVLGGYYRIVVSSVTTDVQTQVIVKTSIAEGIATVLGQESEITFANVEDVSSKNLLGKEMKDFTPVNKGGKSTFEFGEPEQQEDGSYVVTVTGTLHYMKGYTGYTSNKYYQSGFFLPFDILADDDLIYGEYTNMVISVKALQGERPFDAKVDAEVLNGTFIVFVGKDPSELSKITLKVDLDGNGAIYRETTYVLDLTLSEDEEEGISVGELELILVDEVNETLVFNIQEGKYFKLPNGKDNKEFDAWNLEKVPDTYSDESVYVVSYNDVTTEGEFAGKVVFTATYKGSEPVPPQPPAVTYDVKVVYGEELIDEAKGVLEGEAVTMPEAPKVAEDKFFVGYAINGNIIGAQYIVSGIDAVDGVITIDVVTSDKPVPPQPEYSTNVYVSVQQNTVTLVALDGLKIQKGEVTVTFQYWGKVLGAWKLLDAKKTVEYEGGDSVIQITVDVPDVPASISYVKASFVSDSGYNAPESGRTVYVN